MQNAKNILSDLQNGIIHPIYFLSGEEAYFIDEIADYIEDNILEESERGFNQMVLYGRDVTSRRYCRECKTIPYDGRSSSSNRKRSARSFPYHR